MEMREVMKMNRAGILFLLVVVVMLFFLFPPLNGKADYLESVGNIEGIEEKLVNMKQDFLFLNEEIERLWEECER